MVKIDVHFTEVIAKLVQGYTFLDHPVGVRSIEALCFRPALTSAMLC